MEVKCTAKCGECGHQFTVMMPKRYAPINTMGGGYPPQPIEGWECAKCHKLTATFLYPVN